jgi:Cys-rich repeat protein
MVAMARTGIGWACLLATVAGCAGSSGNGGDAGADASVPQCTSNADCPAGHLCDLSSGSGLCRLPGELEVCVPDAGCGSSGEVCASVPYLVHACVLPCQTNADCPDPITSCQGAAGGSLCLPTSCGDAGVWGPCRVPGGGGGFCILGGVFGTLCLAGGSASDGGCSLARTASGSPDLCSPGSACTLSDAGQVCLPVCATGGDGGPACAALDACVSFSGGPVAGFASFGYCARTCDPGASDCPSGMGCISYVETPVCWP